MDCDLFNPDVFAKTKGSFCLVGVALECDSILIFVFSLVCCGLVEEFSAKHEHLAVLINSVSQAWRCAPGALVTGEAKESHLIQELEASLRIQDSICGLGE